jgi:hypothetical protein
MRSPEDSRKRSEQAQRQERDAFGRFCSAVEPAPATSARREKRPAIHAPEASARWEKHSAVRAPEVSVGGEISFAADRGAEASTVRDRSNAECLLRAIVHREKKGLKKRTIPCSGSGVVVKQKKKTIPCSGSDVVAKQKRTTTPRSSSGVVAKQKKTTIKLATSSSKDSSSDESSSEEASPGE